MPQTGVPSEAVQLAEQLLQLVKSVAEPGSTSNKAPQLEPFAAWKAKIQIQNICDRLLQKTMGLLEYTVLVAESCQESEALHFVTALDIAEFIGDGQETLAVLSEKAGVHPQFLGVTMSCVLGRGYFEEVGHFGSRVYKNNELSHILRESHPTSLKAAIGFLSDEGLRATSRLIDAAKIDHSSPKQKKIAASIAFGFSGTIFDWTASPGEIWRAVRLGKAMKELDMASNVHASEDYPWHEVTSPVVDVGGGVGSLEMSLIDHERYKHLEFVIVDLPKTVAAGQKIWSARPDVASRVSFVKGNFMAPTFEETGIPQGNSTYAIRHVLHDWEDAEVVSILRKLRQAMLSSRSSSTRTPRLLVIEMLLLPNSSRFLRASSMTLLALNNGSTRTQEEMETLIRKAGLRVERVTHMRALDSIIEAVVDEN